MTYSEAIRFLETQPAGAAPTGGALRAVLAAMGDPHKACRCIHVAGTNGKGSVSAMLDSVLRCAGYRVGRFISPSILRFNDRIALNGEPISDDALATATARLADAMNTAGVELNSFERVTALAFAYFAAEKVDLVVLEVGLGGRLDPTNCIEESLLSIITGIDFDHTRLLGNTLQAIAAEKAGIIKNGGTVLYGGRDNSAVRTVASIAGLRHAKLYTVDRSRLQLLEMTLQGTRLSFSPYDDLFLPLLGTYQPRNAATALTAIELLVAGGLTIPEQAIREGMSSVRWRGRFELLSKESPVLLFDGAHNVQGVRFAVDSLRTYFPETRVHLLTGVMADKSYDEMIEVLKPIASRVYTVPADDTARTLSSAAYAAHFSAHRIPATAYASVKEGLAAARENAALDGAPILALGSLHLYAPLLAALEV